MSVYKGKSQDTGRPSKDDSHPDLEGYEPIKDIDLPPP
jgi:hypothetical protein